jgi:hypothetical protein
MHLTTPAAAMTAGSAGGSRRRPLTTRVATGLVAVVASVAGLGLASAPVMADDCPNAALRAQNNSTQLPDCRAYELVSPVFKEGFSPITHGFTDDGWLAYASNGNYANNGNGGSHLAGGNQYMAVRSASGWSTKALAPSGPDYFITNPPRASRLSSDLRSSLWLMRRTDQTDAVSDLYVRGPDDVFARVGSAGDPLAPLTTRLGARYFTASNDLSHVVFSVGGEGADGIYEYDGTGADQPRPVSVDNAGQRVAPGCGTQVGAPDSDYHAMSADGRVIFWTSSCGRALYARVDGTTTINASASQCTRLSSDPGGACNADSGALFQGANANGTRVYFTTDQQLVNADTDSTTDLYECDIPSGTPSPVGSVNPCPDLREVSGAAPAAVVQGLMRISDDGSRAYFVATGVLASNLGANGVAAVAGDPNLYVWHRDAAHPAGETRFVARLDPADGGLWGGEANFGRMAQATDDGRYLVFATYAALIDHGPRADSDAARDIYRYDVQTGALNRLSADTEAGGGNEPGHDALFNPIAYDPKIPSTRGPRTAMSDDGQSVVFTTADALVPSDTNGTTDSYLWHDGRVSLISSGKPSEDNTLLAGDSLANSIGGGIQVFITPSGGDVYFTTTAQLTPNDVDTLLDIYDARVDGGFDLSTPPTCSGVACQGPPSAPPRTTKPGSTLLTGQDGSPQTTPAFSVKALTATQRKRVASSGKVSLSVTTNAPGTLSAKATATIAKRPGTVGSAKRTVAKAGTVSLSLTLSKRARAELKSKRKLTVKVLVGQDNVAIARTVSLKLTQPKAAKKKAKGKSSRTSSRPAVFKGGRS